MLVDDSPLLPRSAAQSNVSSRRDLHVVLVLSTVGLLVNLQPSEPFLTRYLLQSEEAGGKGLTPQDLDATVWPVDLYATFALLLPAGWLADSFSFGYESVIVAGLVAREATRVLLLFSHGVSSMAAAQGTYAAATTATTVLFAFAFRIVPANSQRSRALAASLPQALYQFGGVLGSLLGQLLVSVFHVPLHALFFVSWGFTTAGVLLFICFLYWRHKSTQCSDMRGEGEVGWSLHLRNSLRSLRQTIQLLRMDYVLRLWSVWFFFGIGAHIIFGNYFQELFALRAPGGPVGLIEAAIAATSAVSALLPLISGLPRRIARAGATIRGALGWIMVCGVSIAVCLTSAAFAPKIQPWVIYVLCVAVPGIVILELVIASGAIAERASQLRTTESEASVPLAIVFTFLTFVSLALASALQAIESALRSCDVRCVIASCGGAHIVAVCFALCIFLSKTTRRRSSMKLQAPE